MYLSRNKPLQPQLIFTCQGVPFPYTPPVRAWLVDFAQNDKIRVFAYLPIQKKQVSIQLSRNYTKNCVAVLPCCFVLCSLMITRPLYKIKLGICIPSKIILPQNIGYGGIKNPNILCFLAYHYKVFILHTDCKNSTQTNLSYTRKLYYNSKNTPKHSIKIHKHQNYKQTPIKFAFHKIPPKTRQIHKDHLLKQQPRKYASFNTNTIPNFCKPLHQPTKTPDIPYKKPQVNQIYP